MRKLVIIITGVALLGAPVCIWGTTFGSLVSSFESPGAWPMGMSYKPGTLYISTFSGRTVWRTTTTGSIINYHPHDIGYPVGMTVGTVRGVTYYWLVSRSGGYVYRFIDNSSTIDGSFAVPGEDSWGVSFVDASHMYYSAYSSKIIYLLEPMTGSIYTSYAVDINPGDMAYDPEGYLWVADPHRERRHVYKCTTTGSALASFVAVAHGHAHGCAYDGEYVWIGASDPDNGKYNILQFNVHEYPAVIPSSVGKIRALYR